MTSNPRKKHPSHSPFHELTLKGWARAMRHSPTESEAALWRLIKGRQLGVSFKRQVPLLGYIVDFYASEAKLIVEVDGGYHDARVALDARRQTRLEPAGYRVLRLQHSFVCEQGELAVAQVWATFVPADVQRLASRFELEVTSQTD